MPDAPETTPPRRGGDLGPRLLTAAVGIPVILAIAFLAPNWAIWLLWGVAAAIGTQEWVSMCAGRAPLLVATSALWTFGLLTAAYWSAPPMTAYAVAAGGLVVTMIVAVWGAEVQEAARRVTGALSGTAYASLLFGGLLVLTSYGAPRTETAPDQAGWMLFPLFVVWAGDTGAYFAGRAFGKHKLAPRLSPKKTWEGAAGGALASLAGGTVAAALMLPDLAFWQIAVLAVPGAVLGQMGDLAESALKRATGVKDSGRIVYGHGGVLDRVDALIFAAPWFAIARHLVGA